VRPWLSCHFKAVMKTKRTKAQRPHRTYQNCYLKKTNSMYSFNFTIFTPTYNRANTLHRVYDSLRDQTFRDFEWLVIDDGSTDRTEELVRSWQEEADFPIRYIWQPNQGKHVAFNRAVQEAKGLLFLPLDSDDACVPNALERFYHHWQSIPSAERNSFSAVTGLTKDQEGRLVGRPFPQEIIDSDPLEIRYRYKMKGEKWGFQRTEVLKEFPFPALTSSFIPEGVIWSKIGRKYKTRFVNEILRIYYQDFTGATNQLCRTKNPAKDAPGWVLWHQGRLNEEIGWFIYSPWTFFRSAVHYTRFSFHAGIGMFNQLRRLHTLPGVIWLIFSPIGFIVFLRDKIMYKCKPHAGM
jgi:glycosyltransferase involved in cell wall biosynthesis